MPDSGRITRRGLLGIVGASALAGCSSLEGIGGGDGGPTIDTYHLPDVDEEAEPAVVASVPVDVGSGYLGGARDRIDELLSTLPTPFGPDAIPNGHVRDRLVHAAEDATTAGSEARSAETEFEALQSLQRGRERARYAAAGWAVADEGLTVDDVREERREAVTEAAEFRERREYVGADPVRAALVHARIEDALRWAVDDDPVHRSQQDGALLTVAEWGEAAESTRAHAADARHLQERFAASLPDGAGTVDATLTGAAEALLADVRDRQSSLPPEPTAEDYDTHHWVLSDLRWEAESGTERLADAAGPASAVVDATERLAYVRALERVEERVDDGERFRVESAEDVATLRSEALEALRVALDESASSDLARTVVADVAWRVANGDRNLARLHGEVQASRLDRSIREYVVARAVSFATPWAVERAVEALESN
ncbi:hypothetical protein [Halomicrobium salinisoli]|uniref:hypothetical protein n=1 Tax=Halomicrobium salinisoli TaxID=2878391 RepID=UPI001CF0142F|nr:hypothetical protein [Halomicrobium salinisoli]